VFLADFGVATVLEWDEDPECYQRHRLARTTFVGTPFFMAPEVVDAHIIGCGVPTDGRTDGRTQDGGRFGGTPNDWRACMWLSQPGKGRLGSVSAAKG
jgi:hypothetical protein